MQELIDFSEGDEEYLPRELIRRVAGLALATGCLGFVFSALLFWERGMGTTIDVLDRRTAEAGQIVVSEQLVRRSDSRGPTVLGFKRASQAPEEFPDRDAWKSLSGLTKAPRPEQVVEESPKPAPRSREPEQATRPIEVDEPWRAKAQSKRSSQGQRPGVEKSLGRESELSAPEDLSRLLYPKAEERPPVIPYPEALRKARGAVVLLALADGEYAGGVVVSDTGRVVVASDLIGRTQSARFWHEGRLLTGTLVHSDPEYGLALFELPGRGYEALPLAPAPPRLGERLFSFAPHQRDIFPILGSAGGKFKSAGFFFDGPQSLGSLGMPIVNLRGEMVGFHFASLPGVPGSGFHLAADSAAVARILRGYSGESSGATLSSTVEQGVEELAALSSRGARSDFVRRGRVVPSVGVSDLYLGMSTNEARAWLSGIETRSLGRDLELWTSPAPPLRLVFAKGTLVLIESEHSGYSTPTGLSVGALADAASLRRHFEDSIQMPRVVLSDGLEIWLDDQQRVRGFLVREAGIPNP